MNIASLAARAGLPRLARWWVERARTSPNKRPIAAEAFTGGGLYSIALDAEGWTVSDVCELEADAVETLRENLHPHAQVCDAREWLPPPGLDLLTGGPPCQPWSQAGRLLGPADERNFYPRLLQWIDVGRPRVFAFENSAKIAQLGKFTTYFDGWWSEVESLGYEGVTWVLNSADYGSPQARKRAWVVGWPQGAPWGAGLRQPPPPTHTRPGQPQLPGLRPLLPWTRAFDRLTSGCCGGYGMVDCVNLNDARGVCQTCVAGGWDYPGNYAPATWTDDEELSEAARAYLARLKQGRPRVVSYPPTPGAQEAWAELGVDDPRVTTYLSPVMVKNLYRGVPYGLIATDETPRLTDLDRDDPAQMARYLETLRRIAPRTAAKLMDVPNWYEFKGTKSQVYAQIGNGITVNMGRAVARHILTALGYPNPLPGAPGNELAGYWPMDRVDPCAGFPGIRGYPGEVLPVPHRTPADPTARALPSPGAWAEQRIARAEAEEGLDEWDGDDYLLDPTWRPAGEYDYPPGFPDYYYFLQWVDGLDSAERELYDALYRGAGFRGLSER